MSDAISPQRRHVIYEGMVQGVGFRYTTRRIASPFPVAGFVRNLADGRVELVVEGSALELDRLMETIQRQMGDYIARTHQSAGPATGEFRGFEIRF